jgi:hypothetical protein
MPNDDWDEAMNNDCVDSLQPSTSPHPEKIAQPQKLSSLVTFAPTNVATVFKESIPTVEPTMQNGIPTIK